jgi:hypothetical protein
VPRAARSEVAGLLQEAKAVELLAEEADIAATRLEEYWAVSADLITVVADIENLQAARPEAPVDDPEIFSLRYRLRGIISRLAELGSDES